MTQDSDENKAKAVRVWEELLNERDFNVIRELNSPDYKFNGQPQSYQDVENFVNWMYAQAPGYKFLILSTVSEGPTVAVRWQVNIPAGSAMGGGHAIGANFLTFAGGQIIANDQAGGLPDFVKDPAPAPSQ
ncbi:MAG: ester cyclase [Caulobacteraceae bacterium]